MKMNRKPASIADRLAAANAAQASGLGLFEEAALRLDAAQAAHEAVAAEAHAEAVALLAVASVATENAARSERSADRVRDLIA